MDIDELEIIDEKGGSRLTVVIHPLAGSNSIESVHAGKLKVNISSPPEKGKANKALIKLLSELIGVPKSDVEILHGETSRTKTIHVKSLNPEKLRSFLRIIFDKKKSGSK